MARAPSRLAVWVWISHGRPSGCAWCVHATARAHAQNAVAHTTVLLFVCIVRYSVSCENEACISCSAAPRPLRLLTGPCQVPTLSVLCRRFSRLDQYQNYTFFLIVLRSSNVIRILFLIVPVTDSLVSGYQVPILCFFRLAKHHRQCFSFS